MSALCQILPNERRGSCFYIVGGQFTYLQLPIAPRFPSKPRPFWGYRHTNGIVNHIRCTTSQPRELVSHCPCWLGGKYQGCHDPFWPVLTDFEPFFKRATRQPWVCFCHYFKPHKFISMFRFFARFGWKKTQCNEKAFRILGKLNMVPVESRYVRTFSGCLDTRFCCDHISRNQKVKEKTNKK